MKLFPIVSLVIAGILFLLVAISVPSSRKDRLTIPPVTKIPAASESYQSSTVVQPSTSTHPTSTDALTWRTYQSQKSGFRIEYPSDWTLEEKSDYVSFASPAYDRETIKIRTLKNVSRQRAVDAFGFEQSMGEYFIKGKTNDPRARVFKTTVNGLRALIVPAIASQVEAGFTHSSLKKILLMESDAYALLDMKLNVDEFDRMVATFEFTPPAVDTSTWQIYRNQKYGFEVRYPPNLELRVNNNTPGLYWQPDFDLLMFDPSREPSIPLPLEDVPSPNHEPNYGYDGYSVTVFSAEQTKERIAAFKDEVRDRPREGITHVEPLVFMVNGEEHVGYTYEPLPDYYNDLPTTEIYFPWKDRFIFLGTSYYDRDILRQIASTFRSL